MLNNKGKAEISAFLVLMPLKSLCFDLNFV